MNEEFEKWFEEQCETGWNNTETIVREAWQASRKQALDEATAAAFRAWTVAADVGEQANDMITVIRSLQKE